jgi:hypothetical protein
MVLPRAYQESRATGTPNHLFVAIPPFSHTVVDMYRAEEPWIDMSYLTPDL